jgi:hypothetical protein
MTNWIQKYEEEERQRRQKADDFQLKTAEELGLGDLRALGTAATTVVTQADYDHRARMLNPVWWVLEKFNRGQQALFGAMAGLTHSWDVGVAYELGRQGLVGERHTPLVEIFDNVGLQGQAGRLDWIDPIAFTGEIFLDPLFFRADGQSCHCQ